MSSISESQNALGADQVAWVGKDRRVVVKRDVVQKALGLKLRAGKTIDLWALIGAKRQIQLLPPESELARLRDSYNRRDTEQVHAWDTSDDDGTATLRRLAGLFQITCRARRQSRNLRITLPPDLIDLDLLRVGEALVLVIVGNVVELWRRDRWTEMAAIENLSAFTQEVRDMMEDD